MSSWKVEPSGPLLGELSVNGDKSVSHRSLLIGALCDGPVEVEGWGDSADTRATLEAVRSLGVQVDDHGHGRLTVHGVGIDGLKPPVGSIDVKNAGTLIRLLSGICAMQPAGVFVLDGDESIRTRPMERVAKPLRAMGAEIDTTEGTPPVTVTGGAALKGIEHVMEVSSAQVKSAILLAGLRADGPTTVIEQVPTRDHTERMLRAAGATVQTLRDRVVLQPTDRLHLERIEVPGDISSAAFLIVAATLIPESRIFLRGIGMGAGRTGLLDVLERMGGRVAVFNRRTTDAGEPVADLEVAHADLTASSIRGAEVSGLIDELPILALAACVSRGKTRVREAEELKVKESNRLESVYEALHGIGGHIELEEDGWFIRGVPARLRGGTVNPRGDHRIAMLGAIAGLYSEGGVTITDPEAIDVSFPGFRALIEAVTAERHR
ncbi:MAG: 3-phosphoshikimate 1-carboxyvinyltransferase [Thermoleophilia bacterium]